MRSSACSESKAQRLAGGLMLALALALPARGAQGPSADSLRRVAATLREDRTAEDLADRLVARGALEVPALFELYRLGVPGGKEPGETMRGAAPTELQQRALVLALKQMPASWHNLLEALSRSENERPARRAAVHLISEIGRGTDIALLLALAKPPSETHENAAGADPAASAELESDADSAAADFQADVQHLLARDPETLAQLEAQFLSADARLQPLLVKAISNTHSLAAIEVLSRLLGQRKDLDVSLMTGISKLASGFAPPFSARIADAVRACLGANAEDLVREAALAVGRLEDADSIPMLVTLLSHASRGVRDNAHWSLKKISGMSIAADAQAWAAWIKVEQAWWRDTAPRLFTSLETANRANALAIVQEIARRRYPRHPLAAELVRGLSHQDAEVRRLTCVALAQFRSRTAVPELVDVLEDPDAEVRKEALCALQAITGLDLPPLRAAWERAGS